MSYFLVFINQLFHDPQFGVLPGVVLFSVLTYLILTLIGRFTLLKIFEEYFTSNAGQEWSPLIKILRANGSLYPLKFVFFSLLSVFPFNRLPLFSKLKFWVKFGVRNENVGKRLSSCQRLYCFVHSLFFMICLISIVIFFVRATLI